MRINPVGPKDTNGGGKGQGQAASHDKKIHRFAACSARPNCNHSTAAAESQVFATQVFATLLCYACQCGPNAVKRFGTLNDTWETMRAEQLAEAAAKGQTLPVANDPNWPSVEW